MAQPSLFGPPVAPVRVPGLRTLPAHRRAALDRLDAVIISPVAPISGISRPAVISAAEPIALALQEGSGQPVVQVDGTIVRRMRPGEALDVRLTARGPRRAS
jgi:hypothetical protein